ncbi:hypothetical protein TWF718_005399 [Orbilia javanica]|uniref:Uncharacterized protein n=1 Tax=Orbilia javanica TaxID=47235 RepID=A0AAN8RE70_9PEZI
MENVDGKDFARYLRRALGPEKQTSAPRTNRHESASTVDYTQTQESTSSASRNQSFGAELSISQDRFSAFEVQATASPRTENSCISPFSNSETSNLDQSNKNDAQESSLNPNKSSSENTGIDSPRGSKSQDRKHPRGIENVFTPGTSPSSTICSSDDEISDDEELVSRKIAYHRAEREKLIMQTDSDPATLSIHLIALVEQYKVKDTKLDLHLAVLYHSNCENQKILAILKDFKHNSDLTPSENAMAYLVRAAARCELPDASSACKDCLRVAQIARKYSSYPDIQQFENIANYYAGWCARQAENKADELYYNYLYDPSIGPPVVKFGKIAYRFNMKPLKPNNARKDEEPESEAGALSKTTSRSSPIPILPTTPPSSSSGTSELPITTVCPHIFLDRKHELSKNDERYLTRVFSISVTKPQQPKKPMELMQVESGTCDPRPPEFRSYINFHSQAEILEVLVGCIEAGQVPLAFKILLGRHQKSIDNYSRDFPVGFGYKIPYPKGAPHRPHEYVLSRFQFLALLRPNEADFKVNARVTRLLTGVQDLYAQLWKDTKVPHFLKVKDYYDAMILALSAQNVIPAVAMLHTPEKDMDLSSIISNTDPFGQSVEALSATPFGLFTILESQTPFDLPIPLQIMRRGRPDDDTATGPELFNCSVEGPNLFHLAAKYTTTSVKPLEFFIQVHKCKSPPWSLCSARVAAVGGYGEVTPLETVRLRIRDTDPADSELLRVLKQMARILGAASQPPGPRFLRFRDFV